MTEYRLYEIDKSGKVNRPAKEVEARDDQEAVEKATQLVDGHVFEVWDRARLVARVPPKDDYRKTE